MEDHDDSRISLPVSRRDIRIWKKTGDTIGIPLCDLLKRRDGAGKTLITRGLVAGLGISEDEVSSPTYTIVNEYAKNLYHFDLYRLNDLDELYEMGFYDYLEQQAGLIIEWPDLLEGNYFENRLEIEIERLDLTNRVIRLKSSDSRIKKQLELIGGQDA
ncbi:tRNA (adenosine(37)-N6)-threonylcarbamoyltransferase complex ATPase subunit type 1 TsaE [Eubacteriaceae bacterium ES2]|nr:tRNA (adenosine(37)-N6)-threonylcarbamoyltransferase complex ATPase subunit type 1 TsaE [Eubacteriaceae bacterium ES2]